MNSLEELVVSAQADFIAAADAAALENAKARYLGKTGQITEMMKGLGKLDPDARKAQGALINAVKVQIEDALTARRDALADAQMQGRLNAEAIDVTLPGRGRMPGGIHPVMRTWERVEEIFRSIGFDVADGPEIENDWTNFTALNSPMQVRYARTHTPPIKVIAPGRTYRVDSDATHSPMFHQVEGLWIAEDISFVDLKGVYLNFIKAFFETDDLQVRFRPSYFPFTEPSAEIDIAFGSGPLKGRWLEVSGAGQVHPNVVRNFGLDPEKFIGFAFGSGLERLTMLRYGS